MKKKESPSLPIPLQDLRRMLIRRGELIPETEAEVALFEQSVDVDDTELPANLRDPFTLETRKPPIVAISASRTEMSTIIAGFLCMDCNKGVGFPDNTSLHQTEQVTIQQFFADHAKHELRTTHYNAMTLGLHAHRIQPAAPSPRHARAIATLLLVTMCAALVVLVAVLLVGG